MAATVTGTAVAPTFQATAGETNALTVSQAGNDTVFQDSSGPISTTATDCVADIPATGEVTCTNPAGPATSIAVNLDDGDDSEFTTFVTSPMTVNGGAGVDTITGGDGADTLNGNAGDDTFLFSPGADVVHGGANGPVNGTASPPTLGDSIQYFSTTADLTITLDDVANDGAAGDNANIASDVETVLTAAGNNHITGNADTNILFGGAGNDTINARDGVLDYVVCGDGTDTALLDNADVVVDDPADPTTFCENVTRANPGPIDPGPTNPGPTNPGPTTPGGTTPGGTTPADTSPPVIGSGLPVPKSLSLTLKPARDRSKPYTFTLSGKLGLPAGVTTAKGCSGKVTVTVKRGLKTVFSKATFLKKDCTYSTKAKITGKGKLKVSVKFAGNSALGSKASAAISARAG